MNRQKKTRGNNQGDRDIKRAAEALRDSENRYRTLIDSAPYAIGIHRKESILYANHAALQLLGAKTLEELQRKSLFDLVHPEYREFVAERIRKLESGLLPSVETEIDLIRLEGQVVPVEIIAGVVIQYEGGPAIQLMFRDISERKQMERELQKAKDDLEITVRKRTAQLTEAVKTISQSEEKYRELVERAQSIILRMDCEGNITFFNDFAERFFGYTQKEILGRNVVGTIVPERESSGRDLKLLMKNLALHPENYTGNENENIRKNGERVWISWSNAPVYDEDGMLKEILCVGNDITERKKMETQLRSAQKHLRAMASEIILTEERSRQHFATDLHDTVVQTLGAAKLRAELIQNQVSKQAKPAFTELNELLSESILQARSIMVEMSPPVLNELGLVPALEWITEQIGAKHGIKVSFNIFDSQRAVSLPHETEILLFQATRELLMNVVKHAHAKTAAVGLFSDDQKIRIEIKDDGSGFDVKEAFQPDLKGGFGLYSIRERLRHICGRMVIKSRPGQGTTVLISAPQIQKK